MIKVAVDTNILIYALDNGSSHHKRVMAVLENPRYQLFTTSKNISEYFAVTTKLRFPPKKVWDFYKDIKRNLIVIYPNDESLRRLERLIKKHLPKGNQIYDIEVAAIVLSGGIKRLATVNQKDFQQVKSLTLL